MATQTEVIILKREISQLQSVQQRLIIENGQLMVSNQHLSAENAQMKERYSMILSQNQELSKTNDELTNENGRLKADTALKGDQDEIEKEAVQLRMDRDTCKLHVQQHFKTVKFGAGVIEDNDDKTAFYTGLSSYLVFSTHFSLLAHFSC